MSEVEPEWLGYVGTTKLTPTTKCTVSRGPASVDSGPPGLMASGPSPASTSSRCGKVSTSNRPRRTSSVRIAASSSP